MNKFLLSDSAYVYTYNCILEFCQIVVVFYVSKYKIYKKVV